MSLTDQVCRQIKHLADFFGHSGPALFCAAIIAILAQGETTLANSTRQKIPALFLDLNDPQEHDVWSSFLCVVPCSKSKTCPETEIQKGLYGSGADFEIYRPKNKVETYDFLNIYGNKEFPFISISGHHSYGFSGSNGSFGLESLSQNLVQSSTPFFSNASFVGLNGCRTGIQGDFTGNPFEYIQHVIEETEVRDSEFLRLQAAIQQIAGGQKAYRKLFPNAVLMGFNETLSPGGPPQIFAHADAVLRGIYEIVYKKRLAPKFGGPINRNTENAIFAECNGRFPCNLCERDPQYYGALRSALAQYLKNESKRIKVDKRALNPAEETRKSQILETSKFYSNAIFSIPLGVASQASFDPTANRGFAVQKLLELLAPNNLKFLAEVKKIKLVSLIFGSLTSIIERMTDIETQQIAIAVKPYLTNLVMAGDLFAPAEGRSHAPTNFAYLAKKLQCQECFNLILKPSVSKDFMWVLSQDLPSFASDEVFETLLRSNDMYLRANAARALSDSSSEKLLNIAYGDPQISVMTKAFDNGPVPPLAIIRYSMSDHTLFQYSILPLLENFRRHLTTLSPEALSIYMSLLPMGGFQYSRYQPFEGENLSDALRYLFKYEIEYADLHIANLISRHEEPKTEDLVNLCKKLETTKQNPNALLFSRALKLSFKAYVADKNSLNTLECIQ